MENYITLRTIDYRPCYVTIDDGSPKKGLFHKWIEKAKPIRPSFAKPIRPSFAIPYDHGGQYWDTVGLVELENGQIIEVPVSSIRFADYLINEFSFLGYNIEGNDNYKS